MLTQLLETLQLRTLRSPHKTNPLDIVLGTATGNGLGLGAAAFDHFDSPNIVIGETGYAGTIHVGNLTVSTGQLTLIADGENGSIEIGGHLIFPKG